MVSLTDRQLLTDIVNNTNTSYNKLLNRVLRDGSPIFETYTRLLSTKSSEDERVACFEAVNAELEPMNSGRFMMLIATARVTIDYIPLDIIIESCIRMSETFIINNGGGVLSIISDYKNTLFNDLIENCITCIETFTYSIHRLIDFV